MDTVALLLHNIFLHIFLYLIPIYANKSLYRAKIQEGFDDTLHLLQLLVSICLPCCQNSSYLCWRTGLSDYLLPDWKPVKTEQHNYTLLY